MCWFECIMSLLDYHNYILVRKIILPVQFQLSIGRIWCGNGVKVLVQLARLLTKKELTMGWCCDNNCFAGQ